MQVHRVLIVHPPPEGALTQVVEARLLLADTPEDAVRIVRQTADSSSTVAYDHAYAPGEVIPLPHMTMPRAEASQWVREAAEVA